MVEPILINSLEFAKQSLEIHGRIRASQLSAIKEVLFDENENAEIAYTLKGALSSSGKPGLALDLDGRLNLRCQRCLGVMSFDLRSGSWFEIVANEAMLIELDADEDNDDVDYLVADPKLDVEALVEEEILLAIPFAPKHEDVGCATLGGIKMEQKQNPFQVLESLKSK